MNFTDQFNKLLTDCPINGNFYPAKWADWMRKTGRERRMHACLLDSSILDWIQQFHCSAASESEEEDVTKCEACAEAIPDNAPYSYDRMNGCTYCENCTPAYEDMLKDPTEFYMGPDDEYMTAEQAQEMADKHVANGGKLTDKLGLITPEEKDTGDE